MKHSRTVLVMAGFCVLLVLPCVGFAQTFTLRADDTCGECSGGGAPPRAAGPYATEGECRAAIGNLPKLYCKGSPCYPINPRCERSDAGGSRQGNGAKPLSGVGLIFAGAAVGCGAGAALAEATDANTMAKRCEEGLVPGAAVGLLIALATHKFSPHTRVFSLNLAPRHPQPLIARQLQPRRTGGFGFSLTWRLR